MTSSTYVIHNLYNKKKATEKNSVQQCSQIMKRPWPTYNNTKAYTEELHNPGPQKTRIKHARDCDDVSNLGLRTDLTSTMSWKYAETALRNHNNLNLSERKTLQNTRLANQETTKFTLYFIHSSQFFKNKQKRYLSERHGLNQWIVWYSTNLKATHGSAFRKFWKFISIIKSFNFIHVVMWYSWYDLTLIWNKITEITNVNFESLAIFQHRTILTRAY